MLSRIYAEYTASITELKRNPQALINDAKGEPIALLNHNRATAYIVPAETYEWLMELAEDLELGQIIEKRKAEKGSAVEIDIDEL
jgi:antitoxin StbD